MIVLDASVVVELVFRTSRADEIEERAAVESQVVCAPEIIDLEVANALRRVEAARKLSQPRADEAMADFLALDIARYSHHDLLPRVWQLRGQLSAYDAVYVALAEVLEAPLLTTDRKLARTKGHDARIECLA